MADDPPEKKMPWGMQIGKLKPGARETITDKKLAAFTVGKQKKSRLQKEREEKEEKKKQADAEAATIYEQFVASFGGGGADEGKTFLRGGVTGAGSAGAGGRGAGVVGANVPAGGLAGLGAVAGGPLALASLSLPGARVGEEYKLGAKGPVKPAKPMSEMEKMMEEMKMKQEGRLLAPPARVGQGPQAGGRRQGGRQMDAFLEEIKGRQNMGASSQLYSDQTPSSGSMDDGDPTSTNLYLGNLAPTVTEEALQEAFSPFGKVYSIKIMWPRTDEERARKRNCGFVSFWRREDAVNAKRAMQDTDVEGHRMTIGWGKPINKLVNAVGVETKIEIEEPPPDVLDPGLPESLQKLTPEAKASLQKLLPTLNPSNNAVAASLQALTGTNNWLGTVAAFGINSSAAAAIAASTAPKPGDSARNSADSTTKPKSRFTDNKVSPKALKKNADSKKNGKAEGDAEETGRSASGDRKSSRSRSRSGSRSDRSSRSRSGSRSNRSYRSRSGSRSQSGSRSRSSRSRSSSRDSRDRGRSREGDRSRGRGRSGSRDRDRRRRSNSRSLDRGRRRERDRDGPRRGDPKIEVELLEDKERRYMVDRTARYVAKDGQPFEQRLLDREAHNPDFSFLFDYDSKEGQYYRWKVFSLAMGDREDRWLTRPFQMTPDGPWWIPPEEPLSSSDDSDDELEKEKQKEKEREIRLKKEALGDRYKYATGRELEKAREAERAGEELSDKDFDTFSSLLRGLTNSREKVKEAMGFALDHADASGDVVGVLKESLLVPETPIHVKIARLYLLSDVLHNSSAPVKKASSYRTHLQKGLPEIFDGLNEAFRGVEGRMTAKQVEDRILALLAAWDSWSIYPPLYITGLEAAFMRKSGDLESKDLSGVEESSLDKDALALKATQAGIHTEGLSALDLLKRLNYINEYAKQKAARKAGVPGTGGAHPSAKINATADVSSMVDDDDDEDVDGVPLDENAVAAVSDASSSSGQSKAGILGPAKGVIAPTSTPRPGRGQWKAVKQTNLGDPSDSDSDNDEDVDGVPLDGPDPSSTPGGPKHNGNASSLSAPSPSNASRGGGSSGLRKPTAFPRPVPLEIASKAAADVSDMFSGGPPVDKRNGQKDDGLRIAGPMSPPPPPTALPSSPRGRAPISASVTADSFSEPKDGTSTSKNVAGDKKRGSGSSSDSDDSDEEGAGPGKIDVWGNAEKEAEKSSVLSGVGVGSGGAIGGEEGEIIATPKMSEKEQRAERAVLRKVETEVIRLRDQLEAEGLDEAGVQARCEAKRKEMMLSWEKNKARAKEAALEKERSSPSAMTRGGSNGGSIHNSNGRDARDRGKETTSSGRERFDSTGREAESQLPGRSGGGGGGGKSRDRPSPPHSSSTDRDRDKEKDRSRMGHDGDRSRSGGRSERRPGDRDDRDGSDRSNTDRDKDKDSDGRGGEKKKERRRSRSRSRSGSPSSKRARRGKSKERGDRDRDGRERERERERDSSARWRR